MKEQKVQIHEGYVRCGRCEGYADRKPGCPGCGGTGLILDQVDRNWTAVQEAAEGEKK